MLTIVLTRYGQGRSETVLGRALRNIPRGAYYVATKVVLSSTSVVLLSTTGQVGRYEQEVGQMFDFTRARTLASVETSLQRLGLDCIDLVQASRQQHCCGEAWAVLSLRRSHHPLKCVAGSRCGVLSQSAAACGPHHPRPQGAQGRDTLCVRA